MGVPQGFPNPNGHFPNGNGYGYNKYPNGNGNGGVNGGGFGGNGGGFGGNGGGFGGNGGGFGGNGGSPNPQQIGELQDDGIFVDLRVFMLCFVNCPPSSLCSQALSP